MLLQSLSHSIYLFFPLLLSIYLIVKQLLQYFSALIYFRKNLLNVRRMDDVRMYEERFFYFLGQHARSCMGSLLCDLCDSFSDKEGWLHSHTLPRHRDIKYTRIHCMYAQWTYKIHHIQTRTRVHRQTYRQRLAFTHSCTQKCILSRTYRGRKRYIDQIHTNIHFNKYLGIITLQTLYVAFPLSTCILLSAVQYPNLLLCFSFPFLFYPLYFSLLSMHYLTLLFAFLFFLLCPLFTCSLPVMLRTPLLKRVF